MATVRFVEPGDGRQLAEMRALLWPDALADEHLAQFEAHLSKGGQTDFPVDMLVAEMEDGVLCGFVEVGLRSHADGCDPRRPVAFVEGWFVRERYRGRGLGRELMRAAEGWARRHGCLEMASDALIDNPTSEIAHRALGFELVDRCVHFKKALDGEQ